MTCLAALALGLALGAAPVERVAVLAVEPLGISPERALGAEQAVRKSLRELPRVQLLDPAAVRAALAAETSLRDCAETRCLAEIAARLDVHSVVSGVVGGLGAFRSLVIKRTDREGKVVTSVSEAIADDEGKVAGLVCAVMGRGAGCFKEEPQAGAAGLVAPPLPPMATAEAKAMPVLRRAGFGVGAGAVAAFAAAAGFGLSANAIASQIERREASCDAACLSGRFSTGRTHATASNVLWGLGGALAATAVVLFVLPEPAPGVALGPGPTPLGLSAHARF